MKIKVTKMDGITIFEHQEGRSKKQMTASRHFHYVNKDGYLSDTKYSSEYAAFVGYFQEYPRVMKKFFGYK